MLTTVTLILAIITGALVIGDASAAGGQNQLARPDDPGEAVMIITWQCAEDEQPVVICDPLPDPTQAQCVAGCVRVEDDSEDLAI